MAAFLDHFVASFIAIFVIVDPFAVIPVYLGFSGRFSDQDLSIIRRKATIVATGMLLVFAISGMSIFNVFGITLPAFKIAGGLLLLILGINQLNSKRDRVQADERAESLERDDVSIFPLATPLLAGPGAISTVVLFSARAQGQPPKIIGLVLAVIVAMLASFLVLKLAPFLFRVLGKTGLNLLTRVMAIILTAIAVQSIVDGVVGVWNSIQPA